MGRITRLIASLVLIAILLCGCFKERNADDEMTPWEKEKPLKRTELTFAFYGSEHDRLRNVLDTIEDNAQDELNIDIEFIFYGGNYYSYEDKILTELRSDSVSLDGRTSVGLRSHRTFTSLHSDGGPYSLPATV